MCPILCSCYWLFLTPFPFTFIIYYLKGDYSALVLFCPISYQILIFSLYPSYLWPASILPGSTFRDMKYPGSLTLLKLHNGWWWLFELVLPDGMRSIHGMWLTSNWIFGLWSTVLQLLSKCSKPYSSGGNCLLIFGEGELQTVRAGWHLGWGLLFEPSTLPKCFILPASRCAMNYTDVSAPISISGVFRVSQWILGKKKLFRHHWPREQPLHCIYLDLGQATPTWGHLCCR